MLKKPWLAALLLALAMPAARLGRRCSAAGRSPARSDPPHTVGGRGGQILRVTTLAPDGPGSLKAAIETKGPRIIVFEVGGVIDMGRTTIERHRPFPDHRRPDRARTGHHPDPQRHRCEDARRRDPPSARLYRGRRPAEAQRVGGRCLLDRRRAQCHRRSLHASCGAIDENMSASGPRFTGKTRRRMARRAPAATSPFRNNLAAEGLADASHPKGEHSKGSLIHDNATGIVFYRNVWAHNVERNPLIKGGAQALMINNLIYNPAAPRGALQPDEPRMGRPALCDRRDHRGRQCHARRQRYRRRPALPDARRRRRSRLLWQGQSARSIATASRCPKFGRYGETRRS